MVTKRKAKVTTFDFEDGNGPVPAHRHPNGGGWVADTATVDFDLTPQEAIEYWRSEAATLRAEVERLRVALFLTAPHCQGGNGKAGKVAAALLGIPFPIRMDALEAQAKSEGRDTRALWPWLYQMREARVSTTLKENR